MGSNQQARKAVRDAYSGLSWKKKVDRMSDSQVVAIYMRLKLQGKVA